MSSGPADAASEPASPWQGAKALARAFIAAGDPRGELLELEIAAVEADDPDASRSLMRELSARRAATAGALPPWASVGSKLLSDRTWTASGLVATATVVVGLDAPLSTWPATEGLGEAHLRTLRDPVGLIAQIEDACARWPRLSRLEVGSDTAHLSALSGGARGRVTHLNASSAADRLIVPPMPALRALRTGFRPLDADRLEAPALERLDGRLEGVDGASVARRAPRLRELITDASPRSWSWLAELGALEVLEIRGKYATFGDLEVLAELPRLAEVSLSTCSAQRSPILPYARLTRLRRLRVEGVRSITGALAELPALEELEYHDLHFVKMPIDFLRDVPRLRALKLRARPTSFAPITGLTELRRLEIAGPWGRLPALSALRRLEHLALGHSGRPIKQRTFDRLRLHELELGSLELSWDEGHLDLSRLPRLRSLALRMGKKATLRLPPSVEHLDLDRHCEPSRLHGLDASARLRSATLRGGTASDLRRFTEALPMIRVVTVDALDPRDPLRSLRAHRDV